MGLDLAPVLAGYGILLIIIGVLAKLLSTQVEQKGNEVCNVLIREISNTVEILSPSNMPMNFDRVVALFVSMSDKAKATFLYRIVEALDQDHILTLESYISLKKRKKTENKTATEVARNTRQPK